MLSKLAESFKEEYIEIEKIDFDFLTRKLDIFGYKKNAAMKWIFQQ